MSATKKSFLVSARKNVVLDTYFSVKIVTALLIANFLGAQLAFAQYTASNLSELRSYASTVSNSTITLAPGDYWIDGDHIADPTNSEPIFLELGGTNNTYVLTNANIKLDTRKMDGFSRNLGHESTVRPIRISGTGNTIQDLSLVGYDLDLDTDPDAQRHADWGSVYVQFSGNSNRLDGAHILTRGSSPYGLGDAFGKGSSQGIQPYIGHRKTAGIQIHEASNAYLNDIDLDINTYGHGIFIQKSSDTVVENTTITGELAPSSNVIDHELYQEYGYTWWGGPIHEDIMISAAEDGFRAYGTIDGISVTNITARNVVVTNMRTGFATAIAKGNILLENVESYGAETNFAVGANHTITGAVGDMTNGPLFNAPYNSVSNTTLEIELVGDAPVGKNWNVGYITGDNVDVSLTSSLPASALPEDSFVRAGQIFYQDWRDWQTTSPDSDTSYDLINSSFTNNTNQIMVMGVEVTGNVGSSQAPVISNGKENYYDGVTLIPEGTTTNVVHVNGLGNSGAELDPELVNGNVVYNGVPTASTFDDNGTIIQAGATLEIQPSIQIYDERVMITGNGIDGRGAIYTDGSSDNRTRLVNGVGTDEMILLDGDASIGVGNADGQLLVSRLSGVGNFTKLGAGTLSVEKYSSFVGDFIVAEGEVIGRSTTVTTNLFVHPSASIGAISGNMLNASDNLATIDGVLDLNSREDDNSIFGKIGALSGGGLVTSSNPFEGTEATLEIARDSGEAFFSGLIEGAVNLIKVGGGTQSFEGGVMHTGTTRIDDGALLINGSHVDGGAYTINSGGTLGGIGEIDATVTVASGGTVAPGVSVGAFEVGNVTFGSGSMLDIEIGGSGADLLIADSASLAGDLAISLIDAGNGVYSPTVNDFYRILDADLSGTFENALATGSRVSTANGEGSFAILYTNDGAYLYNFIAARLDGDYNEDGIVDAADYTVWRDSLGQTSVTPYSGADGDGNGMIDQDDYNVWTSNYGASSSQGATIASSAAIPEPSALAFIVAAMMTSFACRRAWV